MPARWTSPFYILTLRMVGTAFDVADAQLAVKDDDQKTISLASTPDPLAMFGYALNPFSCIIGPQYPFHHYISFVNGDLLPNRIVPRGNTVVAVGRLLAGLSYIFAGLYLITLWPITPLYDEKYLQDTSFLPKFVYILIVAKLSYVRDFGFWVANEASCIQSGLSYSSGLGWWTLSNVHIWGFDTSTTLAHCYNTFHINRAQWTNRYIKKRLTFLGNADLISVISVSLIGAVIGLRPSYWLCYSMEFVSVWAERRILSLVQNPTGWKAIVTTVLGFLFKNATMLFAQIFFCVTEWQHAVNLYASVHYIPIIAVSALYLVLLVAGVKEKKD